jgi:hypothetical protein
MNVDCNCKTNVNKSQSNLPVVTMVAKLLIQNVDKWNQHSVRHVASHSCFIHNPFRYMTFIVYVILAHFNRM